MNFNSNFAGVNQAAGPSLGPSAAPAGLTPGRHGREQIEGVNMAALLDSVLQRKVKFDVAFSRVLYMRGHQ